MRQVNRPWKTLIVAVLSCWASFYVFELHTHAGPARQRISVRWAADTTTADRRAAEATLKLLDGEESEPGKWSYRLSSHSYEAIVHVVTHPLIADTAHIDREAFRITIDAPDVPAGLRRLLEADLGPVISLLALAVGVIAGWFARGALWFILGWLGRHAGDVTRPREMGSSALAALLIVMFAFTASVQFLTTPAFINDHFVHLSAAQQMLFGDWPTRDFIDVGRPLTIVASAIFQRFVGANLFAESLLVSIAFGLAAVLTCWVLLRATRRWWIACGMTLLQVAAFPRTFGYPKILATALGAFLIFCFLQRPTRLRRLALASGVVTAFLFRHNLGLFVGVGGLVAALLVPDASVTMRTRAREAATLASLTLVLALPYVLYVHVNGGIYNYIDTTLAANQAEAGYVWPNPFLWNAAPDARLLYIFHALPLVVLAIGMYDSQRRHLDTGAKFALAVSAMAIAANVGLMRDLLAARVPDAIVPAVILTGCLTSRVFQHSSRIRVTVAAVALVSFGWLVFGLGNVTERLDRADLDVATVRSSEALAERFAVRAASLRDRFGSHVPTLAVSSLREFMSYLDRCSPRDTRLFLGGMIPEVAYYARRPFGGGGYEHYNFTSQTNQTRVAERMRSQQVPFALIPSDTSSEFYGSLPIVAGYVRSHYHELTSVPTGGRDYVTILIKSDTAWRSVDAATGWPCIR